MSIDSDQEGGKKKKNKKEIDPRDRWTFSTEGKPIKMNAVALKVGNQAGSVFVSPSIVF